MTEQSDGQMTLLDQDTWSGKTSPELSAATKAKISESSSKKQRTSSIKPPLYLDLRRGNGLLREPLWETGGALLGEYSMRSFGESPSVAVESHLSQILEDSPHPKYSLSAKACQGVLNRAERRGKELPPILKEVLIRQVSIDRGQEFVCYGISAYESNSMKSGNPHSGIYEAETARTIDGNGGSPACNQGGMVIVQAAGFKYRNGAKARSIDYHVEKQTTLGTDGNEAVCIEMTSAKNTIVEDGVCPTLTARMGTGGNQVNAVLTNEPKLFDNQRQGVYGENGVSSTLTAHEAVEGKDAVVSNTIVRRLTPLECERLQGYPDGWTNIGEWSDSKGKKHKAADSPRYKALGNSIALPSWVYVLVRLNVCCKEHTMASLFDGIGGFPLIWERLNGKGSAVWASEIEEFPIAVTKLRFPDDP